MASRGHAYAIKSAQRALGTSIVLVYYFQNEKQRNDGDFEAVKFNQDAPLVQRSHASAMRLSPVSIAACDPAISQDTPKDEDSYPNFTRHGNSSLLKKYLTPQVYQELKDKKTVNGVTLEHIIQSGVSLPLGASPPRGLGVYAGDTESYHVFAPLLDPMIDSYHGTSYSTNRRLKRKGSHFLRRHSTNLDPEAVLSQRPDPTGDYILYTRMRIDRSIHGFAFAPVISRSDRRHIHHLVQDCVQDWKESELLGGDSKYMALYEMSNEMHNDLIRRHLLFYDPDEWMLSAGFGRDWPDARGVFMNEGKTPNVIIWVNGEDHLRIISMCKGGDLYDVFKDLSKTARAMEVSLGQRGYKYAYDDRLGFFNACPTNLGTALRASVIVKLVRLGRQPGFDDLVKRLRLEVRDRYEQREGRYTGIFDISNAERLGKSEVQLINIMIQGVACLIELERKLESGEKVDCTQVGVVRRREVDDLDLRPFE